MTGQRAQPALNARTDALRFPYPTLAAWAIAEPVVMPCTTDPIRMYSILVTR